MQSSPTSALRVTFTQTTSSQVLQHNLKTFLFSVAYGLLILLYSCLGFTIILLFIFIGKEWIDAIAKSTGCANYSSCHIISYKVEYIHAILVIIFTSNTPNSVCSSWTSTKYPTSYYCLPPHLSWPCRIACAQCDVIMTSEFVHIRVMLF